MVKYIEIDVNVAYAMAFVQIDMTWGKYLVSVSVLKGMTTRSLDGSMGDAKWGSTLELSSRRFNAEIVGSGHANFPPFATPKVPPPPVHLFQGVLSKDNVLPC